VGAARAIWGEHSAKRAVWAVAQWDARWAGKVAEVLTELVQWQARGEAVAAALSYYTTHQGRMDYPRYRARGLQIGSGRVESAGKQLVRARLKQAGMIGDASGAEAVATVRAWLKSERWAEAVALRGVRRRTYRRRHAAQEQAGCAGKRHAAAEEAQAAGTVPGHAQRQQLSADVRARVRTELTAQRGQHVWRRAGREQHQAKQAAPWEEGRPTIVL
jgi:hypothetical protein